MRSVCTAARSTDHCRSPPPYIITFHCTYFSTTLTTVDLQRLSTEPRPQPTKCRNWMMGREDTNAQPARDPSNGVSTADGTLGGVSIHDARRQTGGMEVRRRLIAWLVMFRHSRAALCVPLLRATVQSEARHHHLLVGKGGFYS